MRSASSQQRFFIIFYTGAQISITYDKLCIFLISHSFTVQDSHRDGIKIERNFLKRQFC